MTGRKPVWVPPAIHLHLPTTPPPSAINLLSGSVSLAAALSDVPRSVARSLRSLLPSRSGPPSPPLPPARQRLSGCAIPLFRPYVATVPWHGGARAFLSQLFPRYGHYCGPNWSSGKDGGSMLWDRRPIDWLDFCCYCHDIGYDTHDQARLLQADLAFLDCLERPRAAAATKGGAQAALLYRSMCIAGLRSVLIPYRMQLLRLQEGTSIVELLGNLVGREGMDGGDLRRGGGSGDGRQRSSQRRRKGWKAAIVAKEEAAMGGGDCRERGGGRDRVADMGGGGRATSQRRR